MTAVEWFLSQKMSLTLEDFDDIIEQANELFEQQIKHAYVDGFKECEKIHEEVFFIQDLSEQYYNQTYKPSA